jgi:hypothetical protein
MIRCLIALLILASPVKAQTAVPDPTLTPGAVRTTDAVEICSHGTSELRHWSRDRDDRIMLEYGLPRGAYPNFEIDHLVPLGLGGSDDDKNLWPEPRRSIEPEWNAERKDELERRLRELVCSGAVDVVEAQRAIAEDWTEAYKRYIAAREVQSGGNTWPTRGSRLEEGVRNFPDPGDGNRKGSIPHECGIGHS